MTIQKTLEVYEDMAILKMNWDWKMPYHIRAEIWIDGKLVESDGVMLAEDVLTFADLIKEGIKIAERVPHEIRQNAG
jgi:hypothetical protein